MQIQLQANSTLGSLNPMALRGYGWHSDMWFTIDDREGQRYKITLPNGTELWIVGRDIKATREDTN
jgi:hypothetical protein